MKAWVMRLCILFVVVGMPSACRTTFDQPDLQPAAWTPEQNEQLSVREILLHTKFSGTMYTYDGTDEGQEVISFTESLGRLQARVTRTANGSSWHSKFPIVVIDGAVVHIKRRHPTSGGVTQTIYHLSYVSETRQLRLLGETETRVSSHLRRGFRELYGIPPENMRPLIADMARRNATPHTSILKKWEGRWVNQPESKEISIEVYQRLDGTLGAKYTLSRVKKNGGGVVRWANTSVRVRENGKNFSLLVERFLPNIFPSKGKREDVIRQDLLHLIEGDLRGPYQAKRETDGIYVIYGQVLVSSR